MVWLCAACAGPDPIRRPAPLDADGLRTLAVLPIRDIAAIYGENVSTVMPLDGRVVVTGRRSPAGVGFMTQELMTLLRHREGLIVLPVQQAEGELGKLLAERPAASAERELVLEVGRRLGADAVMVGHLYRFREREGTRYAVNSPASVAFGLHLLRVADGRSLWSAYFDETQVSLSENAFTLSKFLDRGASWITAEEMAAGALKEMIQGTSVAP
jgi:hypothetical protein